MILGHGANTMTLEEARAKLCAQAKMLGKECNPSLLTGTIQHHYQGHEEAAAQQSKDAIIYVTIVVVFYVAIVLLLIGTNLRAGRGGSNNNRSQQQQQQQTKKHVVEFSEGSCKAESRLVSHRQGEEEGAVGSSFDCDEDAVDV